jgi:hypothetical protein
MANKSESTCIQHPGFQSIGRCKQCGKPFCSQCEVNGPTGTFCSTPCKNAHEVFIQRASQIDSMSKKAPLLGKLIGLIKTLLVLVIFLVVVGVTLHFLKFEVPIISDYMPSATETVPTEPEEL